MKKTIYFPFRRGLSFFSALTVLVFLLVSCVGDFPDFEDTKVFTVISDFPANDALSVDRSGRVYASDFGDFVDTGGNGTVVLKVNPRTQEFEELANDVIGPLGNAVDSRGNVYVNNGNNSVRADVLKIARNGSQTVLATLEGFPSGITLDRRNNLYISNFSAPVIHKVTQNGTVTVVADDPRLAGGVGIDFDNNNNLIVGNFLSGEILSVSLDGNVSSIATIPTIFQNFVLGYLTFYQGYIYATAIGEGLIYKVSLSGEVTVFAGNGAQATTDGDLLEASFNLPNGITVDPIRKVLYVSEFGGSGALRAIKLF